MNGARYVTTKSRVAVLPARSVTVRRKVYVPSFRKVNIGVEPTGPGVDTPECLECVRALVEQSRNLGK